MAPCTLTDLIAPRTNILASTSITVERESLLNRGHVPENDNWRKCDEVEKTLASSSSMDMDPSPPKHISTTDITAMMIQQATRNLKQQTINLRPYKDFILQKLNTS